MSRKNELRKLLPELEKLPEETHEGLVSFLQLVVAVDRRMATAHLEIQAGEPDLVPARGQDEEVTQDFRELRRHA